MPDHDIPDRIDYGLDSPCPMRRRVREELTEREPDKDEAHEMTIEAQRADMQWFIDELRDRGREYAREVSAICGIVEQSCHNPCFEEAAKALVKVFGELPPKPIDECK